MKVSNIFVVVTAVLMGVIIGYVLHYSKSNTSFNADVMIAMLNHAIEQEYGSHAGLYSFDYVTKNDKEGKTGFFKVQVSTDPGGYYVIIKKTPDGTLQPLIRSQEALGCNFIKENEIPVTLFSLRGIDGPDGCYEQSGEYRDFVYGQTSID